MLINHSQPGKTDRQTVGLQSLEEEGPVSDFSEAQPPPPPPRGLQSSLESCASLKGLKSCPPPSREGLFPHCLFIPSWASRIGYDFLLLIGDYLLIRMGLLQGLNCPLSSCLLPPHPGFLAKDRTGTGLASLNVCMLFTTPCLLAEVVSTMAEWRTEDCKLGL